MKNHLIDKIPYSFKLRLKRLLAKTTRKYAPFAPVEKKGEKKQFRIAVFNDSLPEFDRDSGSLRLFSILRMLARKNDVSFVALYLKRREFYERKLAENNIEIISVLDFEETFRRKNFDFAVLSRAEVADKIFPIVRRTSPRTKIIFDTVDVHFVRLEREYEITNDKTHLREAKILKKIETRLARTADQVWCITEEDKKNLQKFAPDARYEIVPNIHTPENRGAVFSERSDILFVGNFRHRPNVDAVLYFLEEIFPLVLKDLPEARFFVVGAYPTDEISARHSENVVVKNFVPDVEPLFEKTRVFVAPLRYGAGMKGKIGQALSFGLPTVATRVGAEGMNLTDEREVLIADEPRDFARQICRVYRDAALWQTLSDAGFDFIEENFSPEVIEEKIQGALQKILPGNS